MPGRDRSSPSGPPSTQAHQGRQINRAVMIMQVVAEAGEGLGVSEVARRAELPKTTAARILTDLVGAGMLDRIRDQYLPGLRMLALAGRTEPAGVTARRRLIQPQLEQLRDQMGLAVAFSTLRYGRVRVESALYVSTKVDVVSPILHWAPAHCTSSGKVLLAFTPRAEHLFLDGRAPDAYTARTITDPAALSAELARIREHRMARNEGEYLPGLSSVAVPVLGPRLGLVGALAVCGSDDDVARESVRSALRLAAVRSSTLFR